MNNAINQGMYWMMSGLPYMMNLPTASSKNSGRWDGSKWVQGSNTSSATSLPSAMAPNTQSGGERDTTFGADYFGGPTGMSGPFSNEALGQAAFGAAKDTLGSTLGDIGKTAAVNGVLGGLAAGNLGAGISSAIGSVANPGTFAGALGNLTNSAFGLTGVPGSVMGIASGIMGAINPGLGLATSMFGGFALDGLMDAFDARSMEVTRDTLEDMAGDYFGGRIAGAQFANALSPTNQMSMQNMGVVSNALGTALGANLSNQQLSDILGAAYTDTLGNVTNGTSIMGEHLADQEMQGYQDALGQIGDALGWGGTVGGQVGSLGAYGPDVSPEALTDALNDALGGMPSLGGYSTGTQGTAGMGVSSGMQADTVADAVEAGISAGMDAVGGAEDTSNSADTSNESESDDSDSDDSGNDGGGDGGNDGGGDTDDGGGPSGGGGMSGGSGVGGDSDSDSDSDSDDD